MHDRDTTEGPSYQEVTATLGVPCTSFVADGAGAAFFQAFKPLQTLVSLLCLALSHLWTINSQSRMTGFGLVFEAHSPFQWDSFLPAQLRIRISRAGLCLAWWSPSLANTGKLTISGALSLWSSLPLILLPKFQHPLSPQTPMFFSPALCDHEGPLSLLCGWKRASRKKPRAVCGLLQAASLSKNLNHSFALLIAHCLKTIVLHILSIFLVAYSKRAGPVTPL